MAQIIFVSAGSDGDVVPLLRLGELMRQRGHRPALVAHPRYTRWAEANGWMVMPITTDAEWRAHLDDVMLLAGDRMAFLDRYFLVWNQTIYRAIEHLSQSGDTLVVSQRGLKIHADVLAHVHLGVPLVHVQMVPGLASGFSRCSQAAFNREYSELCGLLAESLGLDRSRARWGYSKPPCLGLWDDWFVPAREAPTVDAIVGFVLGGVSPVFERDVDVSLPEPSKPLLVFIAGTLGTIDAWSRRLFDAALAASDQLGASCLLLAGCREDVPDPLPSWAMWRPFVPLSAVLPKAAAVVHHAGIGTAVEAMRHGVPQLVVPRVFSQSGIAAKIQTLGVGQCLSEANVNADTLIGALKCLRRSEQIANHCREIESAMTVGDEHAHCDALESALRMRKGAHASSISNGAHGLSS